jgi:endonuclease-3
VTPSRATTILDRLEKAHPDARLYLEFTTPFDLLVATILAAQCTDERVNAFMPGLLRRYPTPAAFAHADIEELEETIRPIGLFHRKARAIKDCCQALVDQHGGKVPDDVATLTAVRGVGRKTANIVLGNAFGRQTIAVDTHVYRVATRLGLARRKQADKVETELCDVIPQKRRTRATHLLGTHGRRVCTARKPDCANCPVSDLCEYNLEPSDEPDG